MNWLHSAVIIVHLLIAAAIVALVLLQRGKGADAGAGFGAGASGTVFGARGSASFLSRTTATLAALFIATSLTLAYMGGRSPEGPKSVIERVGGGETAPAAPSGTPALPNETPAAETPANAAPASDAVETPATPAPQPAPGGEAPPQQ